MRNFMKQLFHKDFTLVVIGQIISLFGNAILRFALPLYLLRTTGSSSLFGIVTACSFLPMIFLSFLGGVLADRINKRNIMVALDFATALIVLLFFLFLKTLPLVPLLIVVLILLYGISGTYQPTVQASIPALVSEKNILPAGAIINQIGALANLLGPILGGMLFGHFGITPILIISVGCFLASAIMEIFITIPHTKRKNNLGMFHILKNDFQESKHYLRTEKPILLQIILLICIFNLILSAMLIVGIPILIVDTLKLSDYLLGISQGVLAFGGLLGGIMAGVFGHKIKLSKTHSILLLCSLFVGIMSLPLLFHLQASISYAVILVSSFLLMGCSTMFSVKMLATIQLETPPELVGKVIALMISLTMCAQPIGQAIYGVLFEVCADQTGWILLVVFVLSIIISLNSKKIFSKMD